MIPVFIYKTIRAEQYVKIALCARASSRARQGSCHFCVGKYSLWIVLYEKTLNMAKMSIT